MGNTDSIPIVSQAKSGFQLICGDTEGAATTQENFLHECPIVSQVTSGVYLLQGDAEKALETQKRCGKGLLNAADGIPVVGHVKGALHYAVGDKAGGNKAMKSATRTTGVVAGGVGGFFVGGPVGAVAGGIYGGAATDIATTAVTGQTSGYVAAVENVVKNPNPGDVFDLCMMPMSGGLLGHSTGSIANRLTQSPSGGAAGGEDQSVVQSQAHLVKAGELRAQAASVLEAAKASSGTVPEIQTLTNMNKAAKLWQAADSLEGKVQNEEERGHVTDLSYDISLPRTKQQQRTGNRQRPTNEDYETESSSDSEEECICEEITIPVVYANMRSINPNNTTFKGKIQRLRELIERNQPAIIAIVEIWLRQRHTHTDVINALGLQYYQILIQDDRDSGYPEGNAYDDIRAGNEGRRGRGILLAWRPYQLSNGNWLQLVRNPFEDLADCIMSADVIVPENCKICNKHMNEKFGFTVVYRPPTSHNSEFDWDVKNRLMHMIEAYSDPLTEYAGWSLVGDFSYRGDGSKNKDFQNLLQLGTGMRIFSNPSAATHPDGGCLDLVVATDGHVDNIFMTSYEISDHHAFVYNLNAGKDYSHEDVCRSCKRKN